MIDIGIDLRDGRIPYAMESYDAKVFLHDDRNAIDADWTAMQSVHDLMASIEDVTHATRVGRKDEQQCRIAPKEVRDMADWMR